MIIPFTLVLGFVALMLVRISVSLNLLVDVLIAAEINRRK